MENSDSRSNIITCAIIDPFTMIASFQASFRDGGRVHLRKRQDTDSSKHNLNFVQFLRGLILYPIQGFTARFFEFEMSSTQKTSRSQLSQLSHFTQQINALLAASKAQARSKRRRSRMHQLRSTNSNPHLTGCRAHLFPRVQMSASQTIVPR